MVSEREDDSEAIPANCLPPTSASGWATWFGWMMLFGIVGVLAATALRVPISQSGEEALVRQNHQWMIDQADQLRRGEINCLVDPDPAFIEELLADTTCAAKIRDLYVGGDLSDPRLGRLRELPNLKCIIFLFARKHDAFLERLHGMTSIEELTFDRTPLSRDTLNHIAAFPNLKSLSFDLRDLTPSDLQALKAHPSLERLAIQEAAPDKELIPLFQSMPRLREVLDRRREHPMRRAMLSRKPLKQALPHCNCRVWDDSR